MINYKDTILCAIKDNVDKMRFLGDYNPKLLKKILYLIVLDDLGEWSDYLDENLPVQNKIKEIKEGFLLNNPELKVKKLINDKLYTNVNSPQTNDTWKRVWDSQNVIVIDNISEHISLTELTEFKEIDGKIYSYSETTSINNNGYLYITEKNINDDGYLTA